MNSALVDRRQEADNDDHDAFYAELERQILILIDDHDHRGFSNNANKHLSSSWTVKRRINNVAKQPSNFFYWNDNDNDNGDRSVPASISNLWGNSNKGTGVFIPRNVNFKTKNKPRRKSNNNKEINSKAVLANTIHHIVN